MLFLAFCTLGGLADNNPAIFQQFFERSGLTFTGGFFYKCIFVFNKSCEGIPVKIDRWLHMWHIDTYKFQIAHPAYLTHIQMWKMKTFQHFLLAF